MNAQIKTQQSTCPVGLSSIEKMQKILVKIQESNEIAMQFVKSNDPLCSGRALLAIGLLQQARQQISAACQNMGFSIESLTGIDERGITIQAEQQRLQLKKAKAAVVKYLVQKIKVSPEAVFISMQAFADDSVTIAGTIISRANEHLKTCARRAS